jgi:hypothetical protein
MAALRKVLQARSAEELAQIGESWAVAQLMPDGESAVDKERRLLDTISARFAWDALLPSARYILHQMIAFKVMDGVPREDLQALTALADAEFADALSALEQNVMLIETRPDTKAKQRLETRGQQVSHILVIPKDFHSMFTTIDAEIHGPYGDRSKMQLVDLLATLDPTKLQLIYTLTTINSGNFGLGFYNTARTINDLAKSQFY